MSSNQLLTSNKKSLFKRENNTYITLDPNVNAFTLSTLKSKHQRNMFVNNKLNPSLNVIKHVNEGECNTSLCN